MPTACVIDPARRLVLSRTWGVVRVDEMLALNEAIASDPRFRPDFSQFADMGAVTELDIATDLLRLFVAKVPFGAGARRALVAGSDVVFGMARMYATLAGGRQGEFHVFRDVDLALEWLGFGAESAALRALLAAAPPLGSPPPAS